MGVCESCQGEGVRAKEAMGGQFEGAQQMWACRGWRGGLAGVYVWGWGGSWGVEGGVKQLSLPRWSVFGEQSVGFLIWG